MFQKIKNKQFSKQQLFSSLFMIIFIIIFSIFHADEYIQFHKDHSQFIEKQTLLKNNDTQFTLDKIKQLEDTYLYLTPGFQIRDNIVELIESAQSTVWLEGYMLTNKEIIAALIKASKREIDIKIILEKNPYRAYNINNKVFYKLQDLWINIIWSHPKNYALNHTKMLIIDNLAIISTGNFTHSTFKKNRDVLIFTKDISLVQELKSIFTYDFHWEPLWSSYPNLLTSPNNSRWKIKQLIDSASESLDIYFPYINDEKIYNQIIQKSQQWVKVRFLIDKKSLDKDKDEIIQLQENWVIIKKFSGSLHAKSILVDNKYLYVWSINLSDWSFDKNREVGLIIKNTNLISHFSQIFQKDFDEIKTEVFFEK